MSEGPEHARVLEGMRLCGLRNGLLVAHCHDSRRNWTWTGGFPDFFALSPMGNGALAAEIKSAGANLSRDQQLWRRAFEANGIPFLVCRPSDWDRGDPEARLQLLASGSLRQS